MEVHHHPHQGKKKWTDYFWEFFMLFLAVFCGFLAENEREKLVEHHKEKQYMESLIEDLETDTTELRRAIAKADSVAMYADSVLMFLASYKVSNSIPIRLSTIAGLAGQRQVLINTDRTASQLKNSGSMRLIRNKKVNNFILKYWKQIDETNISLDRYLEYRNSSRELLFKLWIIPDVYQSSQSIKRDSLQELKVIDQDPKKWDEFANLTAISGNISRNAHSRNLHQQLIIARELIELINREYHLD